MKKSLLLMPLFMAFLCGCKESSTIQTYQQPINVETSVVNEESSVKKTTKASSKTSTKTTKTATTTTTAPKTNTSTIKDLIIDGNGNLVATKSNNTFAIIGNVQGEKGAKGDTGERGAQGEKGQDGRGIDHCELDADKNLIIHYTDGTSQNVGCVTVKVQDNTPEFEKVGYKLEDNSSYPVTGHVEKYGTRFSKLFTCDYSINNFSIELVGINNNDTSSKYIYSISYSVDVSNWNGAYVVITYTLDNSYNKYTQYFGSEPSVTNTYTFTSDTPYTTITNIGCDLQNI